MVVRLLPSQLADTEVFVIDNVAEYLERIGGWQRPFEMDDFPNVAPPFPSFLMEWRLADVRDRDARWGVLFTVVEEDPDVGWTLGLNIFLGSETGPVGPCDTLYVLADPSGRITDLRGPKEPEAARTQQLTVDHWHLVKPALLALSFLHCRNVTTRAVAPAAKVNAARVHRGKPPLRRYRTLVIEPMTNALRTEGGVEEHGIAQALHICRGHFKTYDEHPLFGRLRGTWWWQDTVRGSASAGVVEKDYAIRAPHASPAGAAAAARRTRGTIRH